jgi:predicted AAA+ superfamily ATPase
LLSSELSTLLTGRFVNLQVYPLSFNDYLNFKNLGINSILDTKKINYFENYIKFGALPETLKIQDDEVKTNYLQTLVDSILFKDIITRYKIRKTNFLVALLNFIFSTTCSSLSINSILKFLKQNIKNLDYETVDNYISYLENSFLINSISIKKTKTKEILRSNKKYYAYDL